MIMNHIMLHAENMCKSYFIGACELKVLQDINLQIEKGSFSLILGPSGGGKSTLLHLLGALDKPTSGHLIWDGKDFKKCSEKELALIRGRRIGFVFQFYHLLQELTAYENVCLPASMMGKCVDQERIEDLLNRLGLFDKMLHRPQELSGGEQQRFAIARALVNEPDILLADEPTGNLDSTNGKLVFELLRQLNLEQNLTVCMVSHNQDYARDIKNIYHLKDGVLSS